MKVVFQPSRLSGANLLLVSGRVVPGGQGFIMFTLMSRDQPALVPVLVVSSGRWGPTCHTEIRCYGAGDGHAAEVVPLVKVWFEILLMEEIPLTTWDVIIKPCK